MVSSPASREANRFAVHPHPHCRQKANAMNTKFQKLILWITLAFCILAFVVLMGSHGIGEASSLHAPEALTYNFDSYLTGGPGLGTPFGVARDGQGRVFVADSGRKEIQVFDASHAYIGSFGNPTPLQFPYGVAVDANGNIYVSDYDLNKIFKFDANFNFMKSWGGHGTANGKFDKPAGIAVKGSRVYVVEVANNRVQMFDLDGVFKKQFGTVGQGDGQFYGAYGIAVDSQGNVYVADTGNHRIQEFNKKGKWVKTWGGLGKGNGQFNYPRMMALDSNGHLFVADEKNHRVQIFDRNGVFLGKFGKKGTGDGQFKNPAGIAVEANGAFLFVSEKLNARVSVWCNSVCKTPTRTQTRTFTPSSTPTLTHTPTHTYTSTATFTRTPTYTPSYTPSPTPGCVPLPSGALSWWRGEGNANDTIDTFDGSMQNGATFGTGKVGQAFSFDGVNDYVVMGNHANPASLTVEAWVAFAQLPQVQDVFFSTADSVGNGWYMNGVLNTGTLHPSFTVQRPPSFAQAAYSPQAIPLNTWVHLAGTYDGNVVKIFVNGIEEDRGNFVGGYGASPIDMRIGSASWADTGFLPGLVDELTVYDRALSASEIASIYDAGSYGKCVP